MTVLNLDELAPLPKYQWCHRCPRTPGERARAEALVTLPGRYPELMCGLCLEACRARAEQVVPLTARRRRESEASEVLAPIPTPGLVRRWR